jgi:HAD superfamily hydrolase (TIGR01509 family)
MITTVIFDFFGVLRTDGYKAWLTHQNIPHEGAYYDLSRRSDLALLNEEEFFQELSELVGRTVTKDEMDQSTAIYADVVAIAEKVGETYPTGLLSNAPGEYLRTILANNDLERLFKTIVISSEIGMVKPDRNIFEYILDKMDATPEETIFIDDSPLNVEGAKAVGINAIRFESPEQLKKDLAAFGVAV